MSLEIRSAELFGVTETSATVSFFVTDGSGPVDAPADDRSVKAKGVVKRIALEGGFWGIVADGGVKYDPRNLPEKFRQDGLRVRFEGRVVDAVTFRMWGKVVEITKIEKD